MIHLKQGHALVRTFADTKRSKRVNVNMFLLGSLPFSFVQESFQAPRNEERPSCQASSLEIHEGMLSKGNVVYLDPERQEGTLSKLSATSPTVPTEPKSALTTLRSMIAVKRVIKTSSICSTQRASPDLNPLPGSQPFALVKECCKAGSAVL